MIIKDVDQLIINQDTTLTRLVSQIQKYSNKLLCVVNDNSLIYYNQKTHIPKNITYIDNKVFDKDDIEYYFKDTEDNRYTIFGTNEACLFYPDLYKILNINKKEDKIKIIKYVGKEKYIILYHLGIKYKFPFSNKDLTIIDKNSFNL